MILYKEAAAVAIMAGTEYLTSNFPIFSTPKSLALKFIDYFA
jgi:hypothetical protein